MEYTCCEYIHSALAFYSDKAVCCHDKSDAPIIYVPNEKNLSLSDINNNRNELIEKCKRGEIPKECEGCYRLQKKEWEEVPIKFLRIENFSDCNLKCIYCDCSQKEENFCGDKQRKAKYDILPLLKEMFKKGQFNNPNVFISGGEPTCIKGIDDILKLFLKYQVGEIFMMSSGIKFNKTVNELLKREKITIEIASDAGSREIYEKVKGIDCFDKHVEVLKKYVDTVKKNTPYRVINKYVLVRGVNDFEEEIEKWLINSKRIFSWYVKLDINWKDLYPESPELYEKYRKLFDYYNRRTDELWMERVDSWTVKDKFPKFL